MAKITTVDGNTIEGTVEEITELMAKFGVKESVSAEVPTFKEGDRVLALRNGQFDDILEAYYGTVQANEDELEEYDPYVIYVKGDDGMDDYFRPQDLELVTEEEIVVDAKVKVFTDAGRKPNEYRKGDIVRADKALCGDCDGMVGVVEDVTENAIGVRFYGKRCTYRGVMFDEGGKATLIATVENRLDRN